MSRILAFPPLHSRVVIGVLAAIGLIGILPVSLADLKTGNGCPHFRGVPVCHVVLLGYSLIFISVFQHRFWKYRLFILGWATVFLLALTGSSLEFLGHNTCPKTEGGWPKCFSSLALVSLIFLPIILERMRRRHAAPTK